MKDYTIEQKVELIRELMDEVKQDVGATPVSSLTTAQSKMFSMASHIMLSEFLDWFHEGISRGMTCTFSQHLSKRGY